MGLLESCLFSDMGKAPRTLKCPACGQFFSCLYSYLQFFCHGYFTIFKFYMCLKVHAKETG